MTRMMLRRRRRESGATAIEYGLIAALIAAVLVTIVTLTGVNLSQVYCDVAGRVGTAGGVDNVCNDNGGGNDNPGDGTPEQCGPNGTYLGDVRWAKLQWNGPGSEEWDYYPAGASQAVQDWMSANGHTILVVDALARDDDGLSEYSAIYDGFPKCGAPDPGVQRPIELCDTNGNPVNTYAYLVESYYSNREGFKITKPADALWQDYNSGAISAWANQTTNSPDDTLWEIYTADDPRVAELGAGFTTLSTNGGFKATQGAAQDLVACDPNDPMWDDSNVSHGGGGGGGNTDPNCDSNGSYIGATNDWYWTKTESYEHGQMVTNASGPQWQGETDWNTEFTWDERGPLLAEQMDHPDGTQNWLPNMANNVYSLRIRYTNGSVWIARITNTPPTDHVDIASVVPTGNWDSTWSGSNPVATFNEGGSMVSTTWSASPTNNGGVQHGSAPDTGSDDVYFDYSCGEVGPQ